MHDCPACQVPLHGHEQFCPSCGTKQPVRPEYSSLFNKPKSPSNPLPMIIVLVLLGIVVIIAVQNSWIGQMITRGPVQTDPLQSLSPQAARQQLEDKITANLAAVGATGKFSWMSGDKPTDLNCPDVVNLTIDTDLKDAQMRRQVIDPVKQLMEPGKISTITMNDGRLHATWTYTMTPATVHDEPALDTSAPDNPDTSSNQ